MKQETTEGQIALLLQRESLIFRMLNIGMMMMMMMAAGMTDFQF